MSDTLKNHEVDNWYQELIDITLSENSYKERYKRLQDFYTRFLRSLVDSGVGYNSQYTLFDFVARRYSFPSKLRMELNGLRITLSKSSLLSEDELRLRFLYDPLVLNGLIRVTRGEALSEELRNKIADLNREAQSRTNHHYSGVSGSLEPSLTYDHSKIEVATPHQTDAYNETRGTVIARELRVRVESIYNDKLSVSFEGEITHDLFKDIFEITWKYGEEVSPFDSVVSELWIGAVVNLVNVRQKKGSAYLVDYIVFEPDYLIDISSLAECFQSYTSSPAFYFLNRLKESVNSMPIRLGNVVNTLFDELVCESASNKITVKDLWSRIFNESPIEFTACPDLQTDEQSKIFFKEVGDQFNHLANVTRNILHAKDYGVDLNKAYVEPSVICPAFGLQGRLDFLVIDEVVSGKFTNQRAVIIELKSGKPPFGDIKGEAIGENHAAQLALYRLVIEQNLGIDYRNITNYILYSKPENKNLRMITFPLVRLQKLIAVRNSIVTADHRLLSSDPKTLINDHYGILKSLLEVLSSNPSKLVMQYILPGILGVYSKLARLDGYERAYFSLFYQFIARESYISKCSDLHTELSRSQSSLWLNGRDLKEDSGELLTNLKVIKADEEDPLIICFTYERKNPDEISNFRDGDIVLLYNQSEIGSSVMNEIVFKGSIKEISENRVSVKLRYKQKRDDLFAVGRVFTLERDFMDHSFNLMYRGLFSFISSPHVKMRELFLGLRKPEYDERIQLITNPEPELKMIVEQSIRNLDYYLLEGPPGTGKTSRAMRAIIKEYSESDKNILLLAYTNRAVDEICQVLNDEGGLGLSYIRIGSSLSSSETSQLRLIDKVISDCKNRSEVKKVITDQKIYVGTVASIAGKPDLFLLKSFDVAILDEASQVLEPQLLGLISSKNANGTLSIKRWIMIGDQKQLPAVVIQPKRMTKVEEQDLSEIGLFDCRSSLFERLLYNVRDKKWSWALGNLTKQGRMHQVVSDLPNDLFYSGELEVADKMRQLAKIGKFAETPGLTGIMKLFNKRLLFFDTLKEEDSGSVKTSLNEANIVCRLVNELYNHSIETQLDFNPEKTVGIIAPYRRQIALIRNKLYESGFKYASRITIDTIERFQGSQREVIIYSMCLNNLSQINALSEERVKLIGEELEIDRKLNVALTRAQEYMIIVGNATLMRRDPILNQVVNHYQDKGGYYTFEEVRRLFLS